MGVSLSRFKTVIAARRNNSSDMGRLFERLATTPSNGQKPKFEDGDARPEVNGEVEEERHHEDGESEEKSEAEEEPNQADEATNIVDYETPKLLRKSSSLRNDKIHPITPGQKKMVRFADRLGFDLVDVRTFLPGVPKIPRSAYSDLIYDEPPPEGPSRWKFWKNGPSREPASKSPTYATSILKSGPDGPKLDRILAASFQQPDSSESFLDQVKKQLVCLEHVVFKDPIYLLIRGTVRVRNLNTRKSVHIRYTFNNWQHFHDLEAICVLNDSGRKSDKFKFHLYCDTLKIGQKLELAVRLQCKGSEFWDNNGGVNYCFCCVPNNVSHRNTSGRS